MPNTPPGIYLVNSTGEMAALAVEDGSGDRALLQDALDQHANIDLLPEQMHVVTASQADVKTLTTSQELARRDADNYAGSVTVKDVENPPDGYFEMVDDVEAYDDN
jgi:hypothetical protein